MAARKRERGARPAAGAAAGRKGATAAAKVQRQQKKIELVFGKEAADRIAAATGVKVVLDRLVQREAEASVALDNDPDCRTYSLQACAECGASGTAELEVVFNSDRGVWVHERGYGCRTPEVQAAVDAISAAGLDDPLPLAVTPKGKAALCEPIAGTPFGGDPSKPPEHVWPSRSGLSSTHRCTGSGCIDPKCERPDRCATPSPMRAAMDKHGLSLAADGSVEVVTVPLSQPPVIRGKLGLYLDVDLNAAPPIDLRPSLDGPCPHPDRYGGHEVYTDGKVDICRSCGARAPTPSTWPTSGDPIADLHATPEGRALLTVLPAEGEPLVPASLAEAEVRVAKLEQILLGPEASMSDSLLEMELREGASLARLRAEKVQARLDELQATLDERELAHALQLGAVQQTARNMAERFRSLGIPQRDPDVDELLALVVQGHPAGAVIRGLGVDPGYAHLGFVAVDFGATFVRVVHREKLNTDTDDDDETRLNRIAQKLDALVWQLAPHFVAYENVAAVHAGVAQLAAKGKPGPRGDNAGARRQLEVSGMIRSSTLRYGCAGYTVMPASARRGVLGKGNTAGATKKTVREAVQRILGVRGLSLELSDAAAIVLAGYGKHRKATHKGRRRRK